MPQLRRATENDLEALFAIDRKDEGYSSGDDESPREEDPRVLERQRAKIAGFVRDPDKAGWVFEDPPSHKIVGMILCMFRDLNAPSPIPPKPDFFAQIRQHLPADGRFGDVFNLWVAPAYRRQGLATRLKRQFEAETRRRGLKLLYTHTEQTNPHVVELNRKLGYREIRRGPIWDEVVRVSLVKNLT